LTLQILYPMLPFSNRDIVSVSVLGGMNLAPIHNDHVVVAVDFDRFASYRYDDRQSLRWDCLFVLPEWQAAWWQAFGPKSQPRIICVRRQQEVIGIAPLLVEGQRASIIGGSDVCDYLDFIVSPAKAEDFFCPLLDHLEQQKLAKLDLGPLRPDSTVLSGMIRIAEDRGRSVTVSPHEVSLEVDLPATWDDYLGLLKGKQRHEVKRKLRRLGEAGDVNFRVVEETEEVRQQMPIFFQLFKKSGEAKAAFLTDQMTSYFEALATAMAKAKILRLCILELNGVPVAMSMCFDFMATRYLYNSGFDPRFRGISAGLMCKVLSIKDAIQNQCRKYDFLKGGETYKYRLGGKEVPLVDCRIELEDQK